MLLRFFSFSIFASIPSPVSRHALSQCVASLTLGVDSLIGTVATRHQSLHSLCLYIASTQPQELCIDLIIRCDDTPLVSAFTLYSPCVDPPTVRADSLPCCIDSLRRVLFLPLQCINSASAVHRLIRCVAATRSQDLHALSLSAVSTHSLFAPTPNSSAPTRVCDACVDSVLLLHRLAWGFVSAPICVLHRFA